jgi:CheY-like chemotaxis protein/anti-sigma regulatory factor (Ser/Thr protein kinase)
LRLYCVPIFGELSSLIGVIVSTGEGTDTAVVERLKGEFISTVSHELRTPLTAIKGAVGLILGGAGGPVPGAIRDLLEIASHNTDRLIQLVNDILEIFRMETGRMKLRPAPVAMEELIQTAREKTDNEAAAARIQLETRIAAGVPPALVDAEQVLIVLEKLIANAIKFSQPGGVVRIGAESMPDNPQFLLLWVQDFGKGIPPEAQERIFGKFEQAASVMTRQHQGSGLGLSICRGIVEGHGGRIWVKSEVDKGSTFYATLPVAQTMPSKSAPERAPGRPAGNRHLVMVVDDDPDTRNVIARMLQSEGHFVVEVGSGSQVAELALRHRPEVITLDMIMPGMDGIEVLRKLKTNEKTRSIPVVCISISDDLSPQALQLGAAYFLRKPLEAERLLEAIDQVCQAKAGSAG